MRWRAVSKCIGIDADFGYRKPLQREAGKEKNRTLKDEAVFLKPFLCVEAFTDELFKLDFIF